MHDNFQKKTKRLKRHVNRHNSFTQQPAQ